MPPELLFFKCIYDPSEPNFTGREMALQILNSILNESVTSSIWSSIGCFDARSFDHAFSAPCQRCGRRLSYGLIKYTLRPTSPRPYTRVAQAPLCCPYLFACYRKHVQ